MHEGASGEMGAFVKKDFARCIIDLGLEGCRCRREFMLLKTPELIALCMNGGGGSEVYRAEGDSGLHPTSDGTIPPCGN
jgi:hypothetical protein